MAKSKLTVQNYIFIKRLTASTVIVVTNFKKNFIKNFYYPNITRNIPMPQDVGVWRVKNLKTT